MSNPNNKKEALGKGIRSLLQSIDADLKTTTGALKQDVVEKTTSVMRIPIEQIEVNPRQPRQDFDESALQELSGSIKMHGIIQPLTVSHIAPNRYRLIAGERRLRASKLAGLKELPVYIREVNDQQLLELPL
jgi:ParB family transcriptional regulator, chromosome partitioning protein